MNRKPVEVLAPAGSYESMTAAVSAGADAVYIGGTRFGARAFADNLDQETLCRAIDYVHLHGRRLYLTVNTLFKEQELEELYDYLKPFYENEIPEEYKKKPAAYTRMLIEKELERPL